MNRAQTDHARLIRFGGFAFDAESLELYRNGTRMDLQPQPARLLGLFLSRPGRLLTHEDIAQEIWPSSVVEFEQRIRSAIRDVRTALDDDPNTPRFIETVTRRGYRFIYPITKTGARAGRARWWLAAAAALLLVLGLVGRQMVEPGGDTNESAAKGIPVLAVLPVKDTTAMGVSALPVDGMTHALIAGMARRFGGQVTVIGRTSMMKYRDSDASTGEIAASLNADYLLETTVMQPGGADAAEPFSMSVTLVRAADGGVVWAETFAGGSGDLPEMETEIMAGVDDLLQTRGAPQAVAASARQTNSTEAYAAYVGGLDLLESARAGDRARSHELFRRAAELDPGFAPAYVGIARSAGAAGRPDAEAREALATALSIDDTLAEAYYVRATRRFFGDWDWAGARTDFETAIGLEPGRVEFHEMFAAFLRAGGDYARAEVEATLAMAGDPLSELVFRDAGWLYLSTGRYQRAVEICERGLALNLAVPARDHQCLVLAYLGLNETARAAEHALTVMALSGADEARLAALRRAVPTEQIDALWQWRYDEIRADETQPGHHFQMAKYQAALGMRAEALTSLEKGLESHEAALVWMMGDLLLAPLRREPRFVAVARAVGIPSALD